MRLCLAFLCLLPLFLSAQPAAETRRRYEPTVEFLNFRGDKCFEITRKEADRAFNLRYWEDASLLYRAAKNCIDADQSRRQELNARIEACRASAENALRQKELEARMQARQAEADKLANDAQILLRNFDRSTAFRLADFANSYVAPPESGGNPECQQAIFDAWNYEPYLQSTFKAEYAGLQVPFCFELANNMGNYLNLRFATRRDTQVLYAFQPEKHLLYAWKTDAFIPDAPIPLDVSYLSMDILTDHETLLFRTEKGFVVWRSVLETRAIVAAKSAKYFHEQQTNRFYYYDNISGEIRMIDLEKDAYSNAKFQQQQQNQRSDVAKNAEEVVALVPDSMQLQDFAVVFGNLWLAFPGGIVVLSVEDDNAPVNVMPFEEPIWNSRLRSMHIEPMLQSLIVAFDSTTYFYYVPDGADSIPPPRYQTVTALLTNNPMGMYVATTMSQSGYPPFLYIQDKMDGTFRQCALNKENDIFDAGRGDFSQSQQWFATPTSYGTIKLWELSKTGNATMPYIVSNDGGIAFSPSGSHYAQLVFNSMELYKTRNNEDAVLKKPSKPSDNYVALSEQWISWRNEDDQLVVQRFDGTGPAWTFRNGEVIIHACFSSDETLMSFTQNDTVHVVSLLDGKVKQSKIFGGLVTHLKFIPGSHRLMVVHRHSEDNMAMGNEYSAKLWQVDRQERPVVIRVPQYEIGYVAVSEQDGWLAFSDGLDVRIYRADKPEEEWSKIRMYKNNSITALQFVPGTQTLATGYLNGEVVFWDAEHARFLNRVAPPGVENRTVNGLYFAAGEKNMLQHFSNSEYRTDDYGNQYRTGTYLFRNLDPDAMRNDLIRPHRQLVSFSTEQIRDYDLEAALQYPGNFERLAQSGDLPLIRSFFDYYSFETFNSNNIERVKLNSSRAAVLYDALNAESRNALQSSMVAIYEALGWKLLLRNKSSEAEAVARELRNKFGEPIEAVRLEAHAALLRGDCPTASRRYVDWIIRSQEAYGMSVGYLPTYDQLNENVTQFNEYGLLDASEQACVCAIMFLTGTYSTFCENLDSTLQPKFDATTKLRWDVFSGLRQANSIKNKEAKIAKLESTLRQAQTLARSQPNAFQNDVRQVLNSLAIAWYDYGVFERNNPVSLQHFNKARDLLRNGSEIDTARMALLAKIQLAIGLSYYNQNNLTQAATETEKGLEYVDILLGTATGDAEQVLRYQNYLMGELHILLGRIRLYQNSHETASGLFKKADAEMLSGLNTIFQGMASLLAGRTKEATDFFEAGLYDEYYAGIAIAELDKLAEQVPGKRLPIHALQGKLFVKMVSDLKFDTLAVQYHRYYPQINTASYAEQYKKALDFSRIALHYAKLNFENDVNKVVWPEHWLNVNLNLSFFLLFNSRDNPQALTESIETARKSLAWLEEHTLMYASTDLILTNLAHALWLRNQGSDREEAVKVYREFLAHETDYSEADYMDYLLKDFRDLQHAGITIPDLPLLMGKIKPSNH